MVPIQLLLALLLLQITRRQSRRLLTFHLMTPKILNVYECEFTSDKSTRRIKVAAHAFGFAASLAHSNASDWEDYSSFELSSITFLYPVFVGF